MNSDICIVFYMKKYNEDIISKLKKTINFDHFNIIMSDDGTISVSSPEESFIYLHFLSNICPHIKILYLDCDNICKDTVKLVDIECVDLLDHFDIVTTGYSESCGLYPQKKIDGNSFWTRADYVKELDISVLTEGDYRDFIFRGDPCIISISHILKDNDKLIFQYWKEKVNSISLNEDIFKYWKEQINSIKDTHVSELKEIVKSVSYTPILSAKGDDVSQFTKIGNYVIIPNGHRSRKLLFGDLDLYIKNLLIPASIRFKCRIIPKEYVKKENKNMTIVLIQNNIDKLNEVNEKLIKSDIDTYYISIGKSLHKSDINVIQVDGKVNIVYEMQKIYSKLIGKECSIIDINSI